MANLDQVNGLRPVRTFGASQYFGRTEVFYKAAGTTVTDDLFVGDPVIFSGTADATTGRAGISRATVTGTTNTGPILGIIVGFELRDTNNLDRNWVDGADAAYVLVDVDPMTVYEVQADEAVAITSVGLNGNLISVAGSRTTGCSDVELDVTSVSGTGNATYQVKVVGFPQRSDNEINATYNKVLVMINNHVLKAHTGTAGI